MNRKQRRASQKGQPSSPTPAGDARDPIDLHAAGVEAFRAGDLEMAAGLIAQAIAANGEMPTFHYNLAIVLKARGLLQEASASYERAIALKPDYADAHNNLGNVFKALGHPDKARASFERALSLKPGNADTLYSLGVLCSHAGDRDEAARHFQSCLAQDPDDSRGAGMLLAHLGRRDAPEQTPHAQLQKIYDVRAQFWDRERYFGHALVADALKAHAPQARLDILDIGCGTGLAGALVHPLPRRLDGVDLSPAMLEKARDKNVYDGLYQADILSFLSGHKDSYDAILGAATLIHVGDLRALFHAAALSLRDQGLFIFTLFPDDTGSDFAVARNDRLAQNGCFSHSPAYVERLASQSGFSVRALETVLHEYDQDSNPISGLLVVLQREHGA
jgi:predicted TPR repeat methyltransferase